MTSISSVNKESSVIEQGTETVEGESRWLRITSRMAAGDQEAFAAFYELTFEPVFWEIKRLGGRDDQTSLDILQNTMIKILKCIKPLPNEAALIAWSKAVAKSETYDWLRRQSKCIEQASEFENDVADDSETIEILARTQWIESQLKRLDPDLQKMISFRYRLGWSLRRIANAVGLSTSSVDGRIRRAVESLNEKARREFDE